MTFIYMFSSSMNHLVQERRDTKYVLRAMYTAISTSQNPFGKSLSEGSTLLGYLYRNLNFHKQIHSLSWVNLLFPPILKGKWEAISKILSDVLRYDNLITPNTHGVVTRSPVTKSILRSM